MSADTSIPGPHQRRQFGRREISRGGVAVLPGGTSVACTVANISDGGALIEFGGAAVPTRTFRLTIDGAPHAMVCEIRHQGPSSVGVRFLNQADGARLMAHLYPGPAAGGDLGETPLVTRTEPAAALPLTNRDLRQKVLSSIAERREDELPATAEPLHKRLPAQLWANLMALSQKTSKADAPPTETAQPATDETGLLSPPSAASQPARFPEDAFRGYQPKRSRRNGIKGKSAGGMG